jgi:hypothetical protein
MDKVRKIGAAWGIGGIVLLVLDAIARLSLYAADTFTTELTLIQWEVVIVWCVFMIIAEGYRGFQKHFSPRVVARAHYIAREGSVLEIILAPLFCIGYFRAPLQRMIAMYSLTLGIIALIVVIHLTATQPWRGILDLGVVLGLSYGLVSIGVFTIQAYKTRRYVTDPEVTHQ